jgi:hypothetical protein
VHEDIDSISYVRDANYHIPIAGPFSAVAVLQQANSFFYCHNLPVQAVVYQANS